MPKRFTDTEKWKKPWFRKLTPLEKAAWYYLTEQCDTVGVWDADYELAEFEVGGKIVWNKLLENTHGNIEKLDNGKWWIVDFCYFQYSQLNEDSNSKPIQSYIALLKKHGLWERVNKGLLKPFDEVLDKDKDKDKEKAKDKDKAKDKAIKKKVYAFDVTLTKQEYEKLICLIGLQNTERCIQKLSEYKGAKGKRYKSDYLAIRNWTIKTITNKTPYEWEDEIKQKKIEQDKKKENSAKKYMKLTDKEEKQVHEMIQQITKGKETT